MADGAMTITDLNKACPQYCNPTTEIELESGVLMRIPFKSSWTHTRVNHQQIQMAKMTEEKTAFSHKSRCLCVIQRLHCGLKEYGCHLPATVDNAFEGNGPNLEVYDHTLSARRLNGRLSRFEQVPIQVSRQVTPLVQNAQEVYEEGRLLLDYSSRRSFHAAQAAYSSTSHASCTPTRGGVDYVFIRDAWDN
ncbi:hypothetical protein Tco_0765831 [Tanacetum coccineum]